MKYDVEIGEYQVRMFCTHCNKVVSPSGRGYISLPCPECGESGLETVVCRRFTVTRRTSFLSFPIERWEYNVIKGSELIVVSRKGVEIAREDVSYRRRDRPEFRVVTREEAQQRIEAAQEGYGG